MSDIQDLLARVEAATDFDRDLDRAIGIALDGWKSFRSDTGFPMLEIHGNLFPDHPGSMYPSFTESTDEALVLVERKVPGRRLQLTRDPDLDGWWARFTDEPNSIQGASAPLAILAALLRTPATERRP